MDCHISQRRLPGSIAVISILVGLLLLLQVTPPAKAVEVLSAQELASHCALVKTEPEGVDAQYCIRYIQGFIDGAVATDVNVMLNAETGADSGETFSQRAKRTRAPSRADQHRAAQLAGFCLGEPLPLREVVDVVVADLQTLDANEVKDGSAMEVVYASLQQHYPCDS